jgi:uncharacterized SAM-dependent methyltransferase
VVFYPGSTIGNLTPAAAVRLLSRIRAWVGEGGGALVGVDLHKSSRVLNRAYNDAGGVTAAFNLNVLNAVNMLLNADFRPEKFAHLAYYNATARRVEMHLVSREAQCVNLEGGIIQLAARETIHTENSYKYTVSGFARLARRAGLELRRSWLDRDALFSVHYLEPDAP